MSSATSTIMCTYNDSHERQYDFVYMENTGDVHAKIHYGLKEINIVSQKNISVWSGLKSTSFDKMQKEEKKNALESLKSKITDLVPKVIDVENGDEQSDVVHPQKKTKFFKVLSIIINL